MATEHKVAPLPLTLDLYCPIAQPQRPTNLSWPFIIAGPSSTSVETASAFVRRRYLETLFLPELLSPIEHLVEDILRTQNIAESVQPLLLTLTAVQNRHRKNISPIIIATTTSASNPNSTISSGAVHEAYQTNQLSSDEKDVLRASLELRLGCRAVDDGTAINPKKISDELEKRETLIQVLLVLLYILNSPQTKRKRSKKDVQVTDDPETCLEILIDRLSVWSAVAELGPDQGVQEMLKDFWSKVLKRFFLSKLPGQCASFHLKVFAKPISPSLLPAPPPVKKPRKPTMTRARPSTDTLTQLPSLPPPPSTSSVTSRPPSESGSTSRSLSRSLSTRIPVDMRRSRSASTDPAKPTDRKERYTQERAVVRAPSGKDLFKDRQMTFTRRTSSIKSVQSQPKFGLLGRKTSDPRTQRVEEDHSQTLVFATPSKPRANSMFSKSHFSRPIEEEPERPAYIAETPSRGDSKITAQSSTSDSLFNLDTIADSGDENSELGELMVMTDEEIVPDTPVR